MHPVNPIPCKCYTQYVIGSHGPNTKYIFIPFHQLQFSNYGEMYTCHAVSSVQFQQLGLRQALSKEAIGSPQNPSFFIEELTPNTIDASIASETAEKIKELYNITFDEDITVRTLKATKAELAQLVKETVENIFSQQVEAHPAAAAL